MSGLGICCAESHTLDTQRSSNAYGQQPACATSSRLKGCSCGSHTHLSVHVWHCESHSRVIVDIAGHSQRHLALEYLDEVVCVLAAGALIVRVDDPIRLVGGDDDAVVVGHALDDGGEVLKLERVDVVRQGVVQPEQPPPLRQLQREETALLRKQPTAQPIATAHVTKIRLKAIEPIVCRNKTQREQREEHAAD